MARDYQFMPTVAGTPLPDALSIGGGITLAAAQVLSSKTLDATTRYGHAITVLTTSATIADGTALVHATPAGAPITLTLPTPVTGAVVTVANASPQWAVWLRPASGHTVNGSTADVAVLPRGSAELYAVDATTWVTLGPPRIPGTVIARLTVTATSTASGALVGFTADYNPLGLALFDPASSTRISAPAAGTYRLSGHITHGSFTSGASIGSQLLISGAPASANAVNTTSRAMSLSGAGIKLPHELTVTMQAGAYAEFTIFNSSSGATTPAGVMTVYYA